MCDVSSAVMIGIALAGAGAQYQGQRKAAKATKRTMARALDEQERLRKKALGQSEDVVNKQGAAALAEESQRPQQIADIEGAAGDQLTKAFAESAGIKSSDQGRILDASRGVKRTARNEATSQGFSRALQANLARLGNLTNENLLLGEDSRRITSALPYQLERAGQSGRDWRMLGQLAMTGAQAGMSSNAWATNPGQPSSAGLSGVDYGPAYRRPSGSVQT